MGRPKTTKEIQQSIELMRAENKLKSTTDQIRAQNIEKIHMMGLELESDHQVDTKTGEEIDVWDDDLNKEDDPTYDNGETAYGDHRSFEEDENGDDEDQPNSPFQKPFLRDEE